MRQRPSVSDLLDEAGKAADALSAKRQQAMATEAHDLNQAISLRTQQEVFAIARKTLGDLATVSLEERMGEVFTRRLRQINGKPKEQLGQALKTAAEPSVVRSTFDLPRRSARGDPKRAQRNFFRGDSNSIRDGPELVSGIELTANGEKVAWSIADYLATLEKGVGELLKATEKPPAKGPLSPPSSQNQRQHERRN
jgi:F-type H+-transporting ATPase subunit b